MSKKKKKKNPDSSVKGNSVSSASVSLRLTAAVDRQARTSHLFIKKENIAFHNNLFLCSFFFKSLCIYIVSPPTSFP